MQTPRDAKENEEPEPDDGLAARLSSTVRPLLGDRARRTMGAMGREAVSLVAAIGAYPLGLVDEAVAHAPQRTHAPPLVANPRFHLNPGAYDIPVFLIHGYAHNHSAYWRLRNKIHRVGFTHVYSLNYNPWFHDIPTVARRLERRIELVCEATGQSHVHIVGHSMGGVACRYYVQKRGGSERALQAIMIGSPQNGTHSASVMRFLGRTARQLGWNSRFFKDLNSSPADPSVRFTSIWSDSDELVIPTESARLCPATFNAENVRVSGEGHMSLLFSQRVMEVVLERLCDIDSLPKLASDTGPESAAGNGNAARPSDAEAAATTGSEQ